MSNRAEVERLLNAPGSFYVLGVPELDMCISEINNALYHTTATGPQVNDMRDMVSNMIELKKPQTAFARCVIKILFTSCF